MIAALERHGLGPFTGVPCSILAPLFSALAARNAMVVASEEGEAVGMAAGMALAGRKPVVLMQNAGLLNALNPLLSLHKVFHLPLLLVVSHRGEPGSEDAPEHEHCGRLTLPLLELADIGYQVLSPDGGDTLASAVQGAAAMLDRGQVHAIVVPRGTIRDEGTAHAPTLPRQRQDSIRAVNPPPGELVGAREPTPDRRATIRRRDTLASVFAHFPQAVFVASTGFIAREAFAAAAPLGACVFPVIGSMGCAAPVALGLALCARWRPVVVLDGDGALLMKLGALATIASHSPAHLLHLVFNDGVYASTGGQPNLAGVVSLSGIARTAGYASSVAVETVTDLDRALAAAANGTGPHMIEVATWFEPSTEAPRVGETPALLARRLQALQLAQAT